MPKEKFKSNNYWLMALVGRMPSLKTIKFHKNDITPLAVDAFRYLQKGFSYFLQNGGDITQICFNNIFHNNASEEQLFQTFKCLPNLRIL